MFLFALAGLPVGRLADAATFVVRAKRRDCQLWWRNSRIIVMQRPRARRPKCAPSRAAAWLAAGWPRRANKRKKANEIEREHCAPERRRTIRASSGELFAVRRSPLDRSWAPSWRRVRVIDGSQGRSVIGLRSQPASQPTDRPTERPADNQAAALSCRQREGEQANEKAERASERTEGRVGGRLASLVSAGRQDKSEDAERGSRRRMRRKREKEKRERRSEEAKERRRHSAR